MNNIHNFIVRISIWPVWLFFFITYGVFAAYVMPKAAAELKSTCGQEVKIPDLEIGYSAENLQDMLTYMNEPCKAVYLNIATITDSFYPLAYGLFFFFTIVILYHKTQVPIGKGKYYIMPLLCIVFDYCENFTIASLLKTQNHYSSTMLNLASVFSMMKWFFAIASIVLIVLGSVRWLLFRFRKPQNS